MCKRLKLISVFLVVSLICGCAQTSDNPNTSSGTDGSTNVYVAEEPVASASGKAGTRANTPKCLLPTASGVIVFQNESAIIDASNSAEGYIMVSYFGKSAKVKLQITGKDGVTYTYNLHGGYEVFPLSADSGSYTIAIYENVVDNQYSTCLSETINVPLTNTFGPFLYPNQYVIFQADSTSVAKAKDLAFTANKDLDVVSNIYNFVIKNVTYDYKKASSVKSGYTPVADTILASKTGICLDYASLMTAMLRSQNIPTRLEVGYAGEAYHAWISTYIKDVGWVNGIIEFNGIDWELMDPTFAANSSEKKLKNFIGDGSNYTIKYIY